MRRFKMMLMVFLTVWSLTACSGQERTQLRVVTQVDVDCDRGYQILRRHYTDPDKIKMVLDYLRLQENLGPENSDPERLAGEAIRIQVMLSDGTQHIYYQRAGRFLSKQFHSWQKIDSDQAARFTDSLQITPTDL